MAQTDTSIRSPQMLSTCLQTYQTALYSRPLHPELFDIRDQRRISFGSYNFEAWLMPGAHACRFEISGACASEIVTDLPVGLPDTGIVERFLCAGEREYEHRFARSKLSYMTSVQTEQLSESLFRANYDELDEFAREEDALVHRWTDETGPCMSILDIQRMASEIHAQSYHLIAREGLILRTQSLFEHL